MVISDWIKTVTDNASYKTISHKGGCHCGAVSFKFSAPAAMPVTICNCSVCHTLAYEHVFIPQSDMTVTGSENLTRYTFGSGAAKHLFCKICGVKSFYIPKSHPNDYSVNLRSIKGGTLVASEIINFDGQNWDKNIAGLRSKT